jgi:hypothetical protein
MSVQWTRENLAWCAGIIEGEGSIYAHGSANGRRYVTVGAGMTDRDILERLRVILGGVVNGPYSPRLGAVASRKPMWFWTISDSQRAYAVSVALYHWFGTRRREQVREALIVHNEHAAATREKAIARQVCPKCGGPRRQKRDRHGRGAGWICTPCRSARARELRSA